MTPEARRDRAAILRRDGVAPASDRVLAALPYIRDPILAIFAVPHDLGPVFKDDPAARAAAEANDTARAGAQAKAFESGLPSARVVRLPNANHYVFQSNEADVLREMNAFLSSLP